MGCIQNVFNRNRLHCYNSSRYKFGFNIYDERAHRNIYGTHTTRPFFVGQSLAAFPYVVNRCVYGRNRTGHYFSPYPDKLILFSESNREADLEKITAVCSDYRSGNYFTVINRNHAAILLFNE